MRSGADRYGRSVDRAPCLPAAGVRDVQRCDRCAIEHDAHRRPGERRCDAHGQPVRTTRVILDRVLQPLAAIEPPHVVAAPGVIRGLDVHGRRPILSAVVLRRPVEERAEILRLDGSRQ